MVTLFAMQGAQVWGFPPELGFRETPLNEAWFAMKNRSHKIFQSVNPTDSLQ